MKTLLTKLALLLVPFGVVAVVAVARVEHSAALREAVYNAELEGKIQALLTADTDVIVAGDSRAERQIVPAVIEAQTGRKAVNLAVNAGDLVTVYNALKRHGVLSTDKALILSVSIFQVNDGDVLYISRACVLNMTLQEKLVFHRRAVPALLYNLVAWSFPSWGGEEPPAAGPGALDEQGFRGVNGTLDPKAPMAVGLDPRATNHPWYRNLSLHGARWRVFREALDRLAASRLRIYLCLPPVSPAWRAYSAGSFIDRGELEFAGMLAAAAGGHPNVRFLDFYTAPDQRLGNELYYDVQHVNRQGAAAFTGVLMERIGEELRAGRMTTETHR